jgi:hypothetical protein
MNMGVNPHIPSYRQGNLRYVELHYLQSSWRYDFKGAILAGLSLLR